MRASPCRLLLEILEDRLTPAWAGIPAVTLALPRTFTEASLNSLGNSAGTGAITTGEVDWFRFVSPKSGTYTFTTSTPDSDLNTVAAVYSQQGLRLAYNNDISKTNTDSSFVLNTVLGRTYYLGITNLTGKTRGEYQWTIQGPPVPDDAFEKNDTFNAAAYLGILTTTKTLSPLAMTDGSDWYSFTTSNVGTSASTVSVNFTTEFGPLYLDLYNSNGVLIGQGTVSAESTTVSLNGFLGANYYVHVTAPDGVIVPSYSMTIAPPAPPEPSAYKITLQLTGFTTAQQAVFQQAATRWESIITQGLPVINSQGVLTTGVVIQGVAEPIDGVGNILGHAGPDQFRPGTGLPYHGQMGFDTADLAGMEKDGTLLSVILHEMAHVLGSGTLWESKGLLTGKGSADPRFTGFWATFEYNRLFARGENSVPVENMGGGGTRDAHWRETVFDNELMTGYINGNTRPLSRVTLGSFIDLGYSIDMTKADVYTKPRNSITRPSVSSQTASAIAAFFTQPATTTSLGNLADVKRITLELAQAVAQQKLENPLPTPAVAQTSASPKTTLSELTDHFFTTLNLW